MSQFPQPKKTALNNSKIRLVAKNDDGKLASLSLRLKKNNPQIQVYTNVASDANNNYGRIDAALDSVVFNTWLAMIQDAATNPDFKKMPIRNSNYTFAGGKRSETPQVVSELIVGRDEDGTVWTSVTARNRPMIRFEFVLSEWHRMLDETGAPAAKGVVSKLVALGFVNLCRDVMNHLQVTEWEEPQPKQGGNGGGSWGNKGGNGGGNGGSWGNKGGNGGGSNSGGNGGSSGGDFSGDDIW